MASRRDDAPVINSTNVFAALGSLKKKKKKPEKEQGPSKTKAHQPDNKDLFWAPAPLTSKSWADVDDEDDDDYYATNAPPDSVWAAPPAHHTVTPNDAAPEESESELEGLDDADDDFEDEHENDLEVTEEAEPVIQKPPTPPVVNKETERQLSKKELKKKGLEELEAVLAELGYTPKEPTGQDDSHGVEKKEEDNNDAVEKKENATGESKNAKKKKKKDKSSKEQKESQDQPADGVVDAGNTTSETTEMEKAEDASAIDVKERLKKVTSMKKKKSSKEMDAAARAAANEAAARSARLAAAKKKEKAHYNQQPVR